MKKPLIDHGWLRAVVFVATYIAASIIVGIFAYVVWAILQEKGMAGYAKFQEMSRTTIWYTIASHAAVAFSSVWFSRKFIDRQSFLSLGFTWKGFKEHAFTGLFGAIAILGFGTILLMLFKYLSFTGIDFDLFAVLSGVVITVLIAFYEELVFRGYLLNNLMQSMGKWPALAITALLFTLLHIFNPGSSVLSSVEIFIAGILLGLNYVYTKNLWFGIFFHFSWNFLQGPILGYDVSGINMPSILHQSLNGPIFMTGGGFGFEGSLLCIFICIIFIALLINVYQKKSLVLNSKSYKKI